MSLAIRASTTTPGPTTWVGGALPRPQWCHDLVTSAIRAIRHQLHANAIDIFGTQVDRQQTLDHLARAAKAAEELRSRDPTLVLNVGCELTIFSTGIIPGATHLERAARLASPRYWPIVPHYNRRLKSFLAEAANIARFRFRGRITYGSGLWERVDWNRFDLIGLDYYRLRHNHARYARNLRRFHRWGKPVIITEFGSGRYQGAAQKGPASHDIIDSSGPTPA